MTQMQSEADRWDLYMNGVYRWVLEEILTVHRHLPDQILYMQPHGSGQITKLRDDPPTIDKPTKMWISTGDDLHTSVMLQRLWVGKTRQRCQMRGMNSSSRSSTFSNQKKAAYTTWSMIPVRQA